MAIPDTASSLTTNFQNSHNKHSILFGFFTCSLLAFFLLVVLASNRSTQEAARLSQELAVLQDANTTLTKKNDDLRREIGSLHSPEEIAKAARNQLGMIRPGETIFFVSH